MSRPLPLVFAVFALASCGADSSARVPSGEALVVIEAPTGLARWQGVMKPVAVRVDRTGRVLVVDEGDSKIRVFDANGGYLTEIGGAGSGPGEFARVRDVAPGRDEFRVFDGVAGRFHSISTGGGYVGTHEMEGVGDELVAALGDSDLIVASSARWSLAPRAGAPAWPLARIVGANGAARSDIGERADVASPFAAHIRNFVLPAGSYDGRIVWLAHLNDPEVLMVTTADGVVRTITRPLPFKADRIPDDFMPSAAPTGSRGAAAVPFDAISYGIACDSTGRAYVLTALESSRARQGRPSRMAVDVISPVDQSFRRLEVNGHFTHVAVAPDASRIYLLDSSTGVLRVFEGPR